LIDPGSDLRCRRIVDLASGAVWGVEVASLSGISALERAIEAVPSIRAAVGARAVVSVDVSPRWVEEPTFAAHVEATLHAASVEGSALMLEIAERPAFVDIDAAAEQLALLHEVGVRIALDNLGEGFASLYLLRRLPVDVMKLPRSLVAGVLDGGEAADLVSATLRLASVMGLEAVATGVATAAEAEALRAMGCRLVQGPMFPEVRQRPTRAPATETETETETGPVVGPPLSIEPILGWRVWSLHEVDGQIRLGSITRSHVWPAGEAFAAACVDPRPGSRVPDESCTCGIYAASSPEDLARSGVLSTSSSVVGAIAMWGTVVEHTQGARSQFAYPSRLRLACATCLHEGRGAVAPSFVVGSGSSMSAHCRRHAMGRSGPRRKAADIEAALLSSYGVELLPVERVSTALEVSRERRHPRGTGDALEVWGERAFQVLGVVVNIVMAIWVASGFLFTAYWLIASIVGVFLGSD
jgi:EAL domain-containing protein (putative c-di-GMP-specific phosphodiesterase class I)